MKNRYLQWVMRLHVLLSVLLLAGCANLGLPVEKPRLHLTSIKALPSTNLEQRFVLGLRLTNPNAVALPLNGLSYTLKLQGHEVLSGATPLIEKIPAFDQVNLEVESATSLIGALRVIGNMVTHPGRPFAYELSVKVGSSLWYTPLKIVEAGEIALDQ